MDLWISSLDQGAFNSLVFIGCSIFDSEYIEVIISNLSMEYDAFVTSINTRVDLYLMVEIEVLLLA